MFIFNYATLIDPLLRNIRIYTPEFAGMKAGDSVLDVCCATGDQVIHYAKRGIVAYGIDLSAGMIKLAEKNKGNQGLENVSFQIADAMNLPFKDSFFDYASISFALHEKERTARDKVISEMKRVVKKGGALIFIDFQVPLPSNLYIYLVKAIEFMAGRKHYRCFRDYIKQGGLTEILKKNQLVEEKRGHPNRLITLIRTRNP